MSTIGDFIPDDEDSQAKKELRIFIKKLPRILKYFNRKDQQIIKMRFGLDDGVGHTLEEVDLKFSCDAKYIRKIETKIWEKLNAT